MPTFEETLSRLNPEFGLRVHVNPQIELLRRLTIEVYHRALINREHTELAIGGLVLILRFICEDEQRAKQQKTAQS